ncbi:unnamed protein product, partial [Oppiella nova]
VQPYEAGTYLNKIQCFCFEEQRLNPHEVVDLPVFFYIDPEYADDPRLENVDDIVLSYTFFEAKKGLTLPSFMSSPAAPTPSAPTPPLLPTPPGPTQAVQKLNSQRLLNVYRCWCGGVLSTTRLSNGYFVGVQPLLLEAEALDFVEISARFVRLHTIGGDAVHRSVQRVPGREEGEYSLAGKAPDLRLGWPKIPGHLTRRLGREGDANQSLLFGRHIHNLAVLLLVDEGFPALPCALTVDPVEGNGCVGAAQHRQHECRRVYHHVFVTAPGCQSTYLTAVQVSHPLLVMVSVLASGQ